jgi:hypothetical protein
MPQIPNDPFEQYFPGGFSVRDDANALVAWAFHSRAHCGKRHVFAATNAKLAWFLRLAISTHLCNTDRLAIDSAIRRSTFGGREYDANSLAQGFRFYLPNPVQSATLNVRCPTFGDLLLDIQLRITHQALMNRLTPQGYRGISCTISTTVIPHQCCVRAHGSQGSSRPQRCIDP